MRVCDGCPLHVSMGGGVSSGVSWGGGGGGQLEGHLGGGGKSRGVNLCCNRGSKSPRLCQAHLVLQHRVEPPSAGTFRPAGPDPPPAAGSHRWQIRTPRSALHWFHRCSSKWALGGRNMALRARILPNIGATGMVRCEGHKGAMHSSRRRLGVGPGGLARTGLQHRICLTGAGRASPLLQPCVDPPRSLSWPPD